MHTFTITYRIRVADGEDIDEKVENICVEQSVELPLRVLSEVIKENVVGKPVTQKELGDNLFEVVIEWPVANIGAEITQFLNILYGNISLQPGIKIIGAGWADLNQRLFGGPALGIEGFRKKTGIDRRAITATAVKPLGSNADDLGTLCYRFARGGIDIIKDDHGLANQEYAPFDERVKACVAAVGRAADESGRRALYFPNITALARDVIKRYEKAAELGADGVLLCPHIAGMETMHELARMDLDLPIMAHPAFSGGLTSHPDKGLTPDFLYGQLWRALGADFVIYPNAGGRFSFTLDQCRAINEAARDREPPFRSSFPVPAGGLKLHNIVKWIETYGSDTVFLMGGSLYEHPGGVEEASREFIQAISGNYN